MPTNATGYQREYMRRYRNAHGYTRSQRHDDQARRTRRVEREREERQQSVQQYAERVAAQIARDVNRPWLEPILKDLIVKEINAAQARISRLVRKEMQAAMRGLARK